MTLSKPLVLSLALGALAAIAPAFADFAQTFDGAIASSSPTFHRPIGMGPGTTGPVHYDAQGFYLGADSNCYIVSAQSYDGYLDLYLGSFDPSAPTANLLAANDDAALGAGTSRIPQSDILSIALASGIYQLVTSSFDLGATGSFQNSIHCDHAQPTAGVSTTYFGGVPIERQVFLENLFPVYVDWQTSGGSGLATPVRSGSVDTAKFWFFDDTNWELMIKILDGCAINGRYWVFFAALTNQGFNVHVANPFAPGSKTYTNALGHPADTVLDTDAFVCPIVG